MIKVSVGEILAGVVTLRLTSHSHRCLKIFLIISKSSINTIIHIDPKQLGLNNWSTTSFEATTVAYIVVDPYCLYFHRL